MGVWYGLDRQAAYEQEARYESADYGKHIADQIRKACVNPAAPEEANCLKKGLAEYRLKSHDNQREYDDLAAQRTSALWTSIMGVAALIGMGLSAIGVALVYTTFNETRRTNRIAMKEGVRSTRRAVASADETRQSLVFAQRNADAAAEQVRISEETAKRQLRAYVGVEDIATTVAQPRGGGGSYWVLQIAWKNTGGTPAFNLTQGVRWMAVPGELAADFDFPDDSSRPLQVATIAPKQQLSSISNERIPWAAAHQAGNDGHRIYVWGWAEYSDIFPGTPRRRTECAYELRVEPTAKGFAFHFEPLDRHNGMDFNCFRQPKPWREERA